MKIVVLLRNTVDCRVPLPPDTYDERPVPEGMINIINPSDWEALELGLGISTQFGGKYVTVLALGNKEAEESLRWGLAAGAQRALRIWDEALIDADQLGKGKVLAAALKKLQPDLVLCGDDCLDQLNSDLPGVAAAVAGIPYIPGVTDLEKVEDGKASVVRRLEKGKRQRVSVSLPAFIAVEGGRRASNNYAALPDLIAGLTESIPCETLLDLGLSADKVGGRGAKIRTITLRHPKPMVTFPVTPDHRLPAEVRLRTILAGGMVRKQGEVIIGSPDYLTDRIIEFMRQEPGVKL